jgi:hypothetical protein
LRVRHLTGGDTLRHASVQGSWNKPHRLDQGVAEVEQNALEGSEPNTRRGVAVKGLEKVPMAGPVYHIVFHEGHWRIEFEGLYLGEFATAAEAGETALRIARCRLVPSSNTKITTAPNGELIVADLEEGI